MPVRIPLSERVAGDLDAVPAPSRHRRSSARGRRIRRSLWLSALTLAILVVVSFLLPRLLPGEPIRAQFDSSSLGFVEDAGARERAEDYYGLDRPLGAQFVSYVGQLARSGAPPWQENYRDLRSKVMSGRASDAEKAELKQRSVAEAHRILEIAPEDLFTVEELSDPAPATPRVDPWHRCAECGEAMMETRSRQLEQHEVCIPCFERAVYGELRTLGI